MCIHIHNLIDVMMIVISDLDQNKCLYITFKYILSGIRHRNHLHSKYSVKPTQQSCFENKTFYCSNPRRIYKADTLKNA